MEPSRRAHMWLPFLLLVLAGCGRVGFAAPDASVNGGMDGAQADAGSDRDGCTGPASKCGPGASFVGCGDGERAKGEDCDDGNDASGDGCTERCQLEANFICDTPGKACISSVVCGDGVVLGAETCDDGNSKRRDGCDADCMLEPGYECPAPGLACRSAKCGDGIVAGFEECDFGKEQNDGCQQCFIVDGFDCDGDSCAVTSCGDGVVERGEQCEDGNEVPFDGCFECRLEPVCNDGVCEAVCGDGQRFDSEACDDGNARDGDGCSAECQLETGFACEDQNADPAPMVALPVIYRDFIGQGNSLRDGAACTDPTSTPGLSVADACYHIDFNGLGGGGIAGIVRQQLGNEGTPAYACPGGDCTANPGRQGEPDLAQRRNANGEGPFSEWYDSDSTNNVTVHDELSLLLQGDGSYVFDATGDFYPLDTRGWVATGDEALASDGCPHNVSFSSETHFWFEYRGGERFDFSGDDDTWVFVNGTLAIDLGGLHGSERGTFTLDGDTDDAGPDTADGTGVAVSFIGRGHESTSNLDLGLTVGGVYEVVMFQAERNECGSNFKITMRDFNKPLSVCTSACGDGVVSSAELCDDGADANTGKYNACGEDCLSLGPYCGDGVRQAGKGEECDDGTNVSTRGEGCGPGCKKPSFCGDGIIQSDVSNEQCDDGNDVAGDGCGSDCRYEIL